MKTQNVNLKEMLSILRSKEIGIIQVENIKANVYRLYFANGFIGTFNEDDHVHNAIRSSNLTKKNKLAREIIEKASDYVPKTLIIFN